MKFVQKGPFSSESGKTSRREIRKATGKASKAAEKAAREEQIDRILARVREQLLKDLPDDPDGILTLDKIEELALDVRERVGRAVAQELSQEQATAAAKEIEKEEQANKHQCERCSRLAGYRGSRERTIVTMAGPVCVLRRFYYCKRCDHCTMPVDRRLALPVHSYTPLVERWVAEICAGHAYHRGVDLLFRLGRVDISKKEAQRITIAVGEWLQMEARQQMERVFRSHPRVSHIKQCDPEAVARQRCEKGKTLYVLMDGVMTPMKDGSYREARVGCSILTNDKQEVEEAYYTHSLLDAQTFGKAHYTTTAAAGLAEVPKVVALGDGAQWIWTQVSTHYPGAIQILDWYHAQEYLWSAARACFSETNPSRTNPSGTNPSGGKTEIGVNSEPEITKWVEAAKKLMWEGKIEQVIQAVKDLPTRNEQARETIRTTVVYYQNNRERMHYDRYREQGLQVGSGTVESACKQVVSARVKGAGMRWSDVGAMAMGCIRAAILSTNGIEKHLNRWQGRQLALVPTS